MATMNISLPDDMKAWIENQADGQRYSNTSDYMRDLVRKEQQRTRVLAELHALIEEGIASGPGTRTMDEIFEEAMRQADASPRA